MADVKQVLKVKLKHLHYTEKYLHTQRPERVELEELFASLRTVLAEKSESPKAAENRLI